MPWSKTISDTEKLNKLKVQHLTCNWLTKFSWLASFNMTFALLAYRTVSNVQLWSKVDVRNSGYDHCVVYCLTVLIIFLRYLFPKSHPRFNQHWVKKPNGKVKQILAGRSNVQTVEICILSDVTMPQPCITVIVIKMLRPDITHWLPRQLTIRCALGEVMLRNVLWDRKLLL